jgi:hypothetical protein
MTELDKLLGYCGENDRVCPMPLSWHQVWDMLPGKKRGSGWEPPPPLILAAWWETSDQAKRERFELHLRWAAEHGALDKVAQFLRSFPEIEWHHSGDAPF